jgi:hypothetical protein
MRAQCRRKRSAGRKGTGIVCKVSEQTEHALVEPLSALQPSVTCGSVGLDLEQAMEKGAKEALAAMYATIIGTLR